MEFKSICKYYPFRVTVSLLAAFLAGALWTLVFTGGNVANGPGDPLFWAIVCTLFLPAVLYWQQNCIGTMYRKCCSCLMP